jgi:hypothetical protein
MLRRTILSGEALQNQSFAITNLPGRALVIPAALAYKPPAVTLC